MCGIAGALLLHDPPEAFERRLRVMTDVLTHRGPDQQGVFVGKNGGLGSRRLVVIDPDGGEQPISDESGRVHLVYNGEVYNFQEIRTELSGKGHSFRSRCDSEVVLRAYLSYGESFLEKLNGMFALAILDERGASPFLLLARDRVGIKPLYYAAAKDRVLFGSELSALLSFDPSLGKEIDSVALDQYLTLEFVPAPRTLYPGIRKLEPGHFLTFWPGEEVRSNRYWEAPREPVSTGSFDSMAGDLRSLLEDAVTKRLVSDVPLGVFLSGGVDSALVAAMALRGGSRIRTFSLKLPGSSYDESEFAADVARHLGTDHCELSMDEPGPEFLNEILPSLSDPIADTSILPTYLLCREARKHITVALSGDGGDELFAGYDTYRADRVARPLTLLPRSLRRGLFQMVEQGVRPTGGKKGARNSLLRFLEGLSLPNELGHLRWMVYLSEQRRKELYRSDLFEELEDTDTWAPLSSSLARARHNDPLDRALMADLNIFLPDDILAKVDRVSMACSLEVRVPFLDHRLVELASRFPSSAKMQGLKTKRVLRKASEGLLPSSTINRKKQGFSSPVKIWLNQALRPLLDDMLEDAPFFDRLRIQQQTLRDWAREHQEERINHAHRLWPLLLLHLLGRGSI